jgi:excinuclease UvrABC helicase subunit UvrB
MLFRNFNRFFNDFDIINELLLSELNPNGNQKTEKGSDKNGEWVRTTFTSLDGSLTYSYLTRQPKQKDNELQSLKHKLELSVKNQDFEMAVELRDKIKKIEENKEVLSKLETELSECVKNQDYEEAIKLRDKIKSLK